MLITDIKKAINAGITGDSVEDIDPRAVTAALCVKEHLTKPKWSMRTLNGVLKDIEQAGAVITADEVAMTLFAFIEEKLVLALHTVDGKMFYHFKGHRAESWSSDFSNENVEVEVYSDPDEDENLEFDEYDDVQYPSFGEGMN